jgi:hypothetical protein
MERVLITAKEDWIHIVKQEVYKDKYGYKGEVAWYTDINENIQRISSIHLELSSRFRRLFRIEKGAN